MLLLQATSIKKQYGARTILDFDSLQIYEGDKIGIVGGNGAGKTTLMEILAKEIPSDQGHVECEREFSYIRQMPEGSSFLSGGEKAKEQIVGEVYARDSILFADEPTANLDAEGVAWVRKLLQRAPTALLISHDRTLLDDVCTRIIEVKNGKLRFFTGNYTAYENKLAEEKAQQQLQYTQYQRQKGQLLEAIADKDGHVARQRQKKRREYAKNSSEARLGGHKRAASMKKQEQIKKVLQHRLENLESVDKVKKEPGIAINFSLTAPPGNKQVITCTGLSFSYGEKVIFKDAGFVVKNNAKVAVTGKNGAGKSTLLHLIYQGHDAIRCAPKLKLGFLYQDFRNLEEEKTVLDNVLSTSIQDTATVRNVLAGLLFRGDDVFKSVSVLSGGEKMRLSIAKLVTGDNNALLLDEPTNFLDIASLEAVERVLKSYPGTIVLVSHDQRFVRSVTQEELRVADGDIQPVIEQAKRPVNSANKTVLELRRIRLLSEISAAPPEEKTRLEAEYNQVVRDINAF